LITKSFWGGAQKYVFDMATSLPKGAFEPVVVSSDGSLLDKLEEQGIRTIAVKRFSRNINILSEPLVFFEFVKIFREERPDIAHLNSSKAGAIGALAARICRVSKIVFTSHGWAFNEDRPVWQKFLIRIFVWVSLVLADRVICVSAKTKNDVKNFPFVRSKTEIIYNGVKPYGLLSREEAREKIMEKIGLSRLAGGSVAGQPVFLKKDMVCVGTISELHKNKGLSYAIKAVSGLKDLPVVFVIIGEGELEENLKSQISNLKLENKVFLLGRIEGAKRYLEAFDIFTLTSVTEAFPYSLLEAGFAGLPVVASSVGGVPEVIQDEKNGILIQSKNWQEAASAIRKLSLSPQLREFLGNNLKETVKARFLFEDAFEKTLNLYVEPD
jgi:glycosyltransferase involved in cell wall biosynthesis